MLDNARARGIRNCNPGNIRVARGVSWQGQAHEQSDPQFVCFSAPCWGIRALAKLLQTYNRPVAEKGRGCLTLRQIINRWAPPVENDTGSYLAGVCRDTGFGPDAHLDLRCYHELEPLVCAIIRHENGEQPYSLDVVDMGLNLAGVAK